MSEAIIIALIGLGSGGLATGFLKVLEHLLGKSKVKAEQDHGIRSELRLDLDSTRKEVKDLKLEVDTLEEEVDEWKVKYFAMLEENIKLRPKP